jgi:hypothetical protein
LSAQSVESSIVLMIADCFSIVPMHQPVFPAKYLVNTSIFLQCILYCNTVYNVFLRDVSCHDAHGLCICFEHFWNCDAQESE